MQNLISISLLTLATLSHGAIQLENSDAIRKQLGLTAYSQSKRLKDIKVAVIDNGFSGYDAEKKTLPSSTKLIAKYDPEFIKKYGLGDPETNEGLTPSEHGHTMAQIVWWTTGATAEGPQFYLLNSNGITNFRRAVRYAIEEKVDIILYSQNRECCGNFDGKGFLNDIVTDATRAGILWVNAAGNYGGRVYNGSVAEVTQKSLKLKSHLDENPAQVILTWNSSGAEETTGTDKDLDLFIYDENGSVAAKSTLKQVFKKKELADGETFLPRERIRFDFSKNKKSNYRIVVKDKSNQFGSGDRVRIVVIPERQPVVDKERNTMVDAVELVDSTPYNEIMVPADHPEVITVGDLTQYSAKGPTVDGREKPEIIMESSIASFSNGQSSEGTSNSAAYLAGVLSVLKSYKKDLTREKILRFPKRVVSQITPVTLGEVLGLHQKIVNSIESMTNESPVMAGRHPDGRYVLGIRKSPLQVPALKNACRLPEDGDYEVYFANWNREGLYCYTRIVAQEGSNRAPYPWETNGSNRHSYVEIRQVFPSGGNRPTPLSKNLWLTPTPEELNRD